MKNLLKYIPVALILLLSFTACSDDETTPVQPSVLLESVQLNLPDAVRAKLYTDKTGTTALPLVVGEQLTLDFTTTPSLDEVTFPEMEWTSSDPAVATIDNGGRIVAQSAGSAIITLSPSTLNLFVTTSIKVNVVATVVPVTAITITDDAEQTDEEYGLPSCYVGEKMTLTASVTPDEATYQSVMWSSGNTQIATIDPVSGEVSGLARGKVTLTATALDTDAVTATHEIFIDQVINPLGIKVTNAPASDAIFSLSDYSYTLDYETYPTVSTKSKIEWTSSDSSIATVSRGVVTFLKYGSVKITATCAESTETLPAGFAREMTFDFSIPAGFYRDHFLDLDHLWWVSDTNGAVLERKQNAETGEYYMKMTPASGSKARGDIRRNKGAVSYISRDYPILCYRIDDVADLYKGTVTGRNIAMDTSGDVGGVKFSGRIGGAGAQKWKTKYTCSDGSAILIYDISEQVFQTGGLMPENVVGEFGTYKIVYADIAPGTAPATIPYRLFWFHTFKTVDELNTYLSEWSTRTKITYE